ncbi:hypothetical protein [Methanobrevibacter filiformis]|uniref:Uncharacterized protein n=1 Tax=Methanobrevibacter filiformis TaxID=55758 RepID=A0A165YU71_9EURY|nr:hypothetical protein [Methanobrevibacter filiformis]KZX09871.1 hypothetical protein MBFIL_19460 [Methanobrevibacter filiformis]
MYNNVKEVYKKFYELEDKYKLNKSRVKEVYFWQLIRTEIFNEICEKTLNKTPKKEKNRNKISLKQIGLKNNLLDSNQEKKVIIVPNQEKFIENGEILDKYSYFLNNIFKKDEIEIIEKSNEKLLLKSKINNKIRLLKLCENKRQRLYNIEEELKKTFNIKINLLKIIKKAVLCFKYEYNEYDKLMKLKKPKYLIVVEISKNQAMIAAAKNNNVEVIGLQHGIIDEFSIDYNYSDKCKNEINYFPDKLLTFGEYWNQMANYPIDPDKIIPIGFPYLESKTWRYLTNARQNQILFISNKYIGKKLSEFAYEIAILLKDYTIIYKLSKDETPEDYEYLTGNDNTGNIKVISAKEDSIKDEDEIYELLSTSKYQVGMDPVAIYKGLFFTNKIFLLDDKLNNLIDEKIAIKINSPEEIVEYIDKFKLHKHIRHYFFKKFEREELLKVFNINNSKKITMNHRK